jgi:hypothetical protein
MSQWRDVIPRVVLAIGFLWTLYNLTGVLGDADEVAHAKRAEAVEYLTTGLATAFVPTLAACILAILFKVIFKE